MRLDRVEKVDQGPREQSKDSSEESRRRNRDAEHLCLAWDLPVPVSGRRHRCSSLRVWLATDCSSVQIGVNKAADAAELRDSLGAGQTPPALAPPSPQDWSGVRPRLQRWSSEVE